MHQSKLINRGKSASNSKHVLILGDDIRSFLSIVRSLGRAGYVVHVAPFDHSSAALYSKYIESVIHIPPFLGSETWLEAVKDAISLGNYDIVIPCDERTLIPLNMYREELGKLTKIAIPSERAIEVLFDKINTRKLATKLGIPIAEGKEIHSREEIHELARQWGDHLVLKPTKSFEPTKLYRRQSVQIVKVASDRENLKLQNADQWFVERFWPGVGIGVSILAQRGQIRRAFQHERIREPSRGGGSSYRFSVPLNSELFEACQKITEDLEYSGIAMFEFRYRPSTQEFILIEVNARPWGSLPLAIFAGVDFPKHWCEQILENDVEKDLKYKHDVYARNSITDLYNVFEQIRSQTTVLSKIAYSFSVAAELRRLFMGRELNDAFALDDPRPGVADFYNSLRRKGVRFLRRFRPIELYFMRNTRLKNLTAIERFAAHLNAGPLVFVCQGNIYRSCFASALASKYMVGVIENLSITSAGVIPTQGRLSPTSARNAAKNWDIDLTDHRSSFFDRNLAESSGLIVTFDKRTHDDILKLYPHIRHHDKIISLFSLDNEGSRGREITDPNDKSEEFVKKIYSRINVCLKNLNKQLCAEAPEKF